MVHGCNKERQSFSLTQPTCDVTNGRTTESRSAAYSAVSVLTFPKRARVSTLGVSAHGTDVKYVRLVANKQPTFVRIEADTARSYLSQIWGFGPQP